jgi:CRISPR-associated protein Cmr3
MIGVKLSAVDTLYFRESTPYANNLTSPEHPGGRFPPHPATVVGALRAQLARGQGWRSGPWPPEITQVLGDGHGPDDLGQLRFDGPYLLHHDEPVFAMPANVLGELDGETWTPRVALTAGRPVGCDLGEAVRLPETPPGAAGDTRLVPGTDRWLTREGMAAVLRGGVPASDEVVRSSDLWHVEPRVGIQRDDETRTVREEMLYTSRHIRPARGVTIGVRIDGVPDGWWDRCGVTVPLGGEGRWAESQPWHDDAACEAPLSEVLASRKALVIALTSIDADGEFFRARGRITALGDATIVSACLPRVERVGGWATDRGGGRPLPLRSILPAGSTFFCEIGDPAGLRAAIECADGLPRVGQRQRWGFGAVAIGLWQDRGTR